MRRPFKLVARGGAWLGPLSRACGAGLLTALWVGLVLAEAGHFSAGVAWGAAVLVGGSAWWPFRHCGAGSAAAPGISHGLLAVGALGLCSLALTIPPSEFLLGGWDPGVYVHTASLLAREGALLPEAADLAALDAESRMLFGRQGPDVWEPFLGMRMLPDGRLSPQFYHLYPVLMALVWPCGGVPAALLVNPLLNALSILLMYLWACRWVRPRWAFAAALLLALNPAQVWQARFATAELLAQVLLLSGLVATDRALAGKTRDRGTALLSNSHRGTGCQPVFHGQDLPACSAQAGAHATGATPCGSWPDENCWALLAGAAFGLMMLAKYEALLFVVPFAIFLLAGLRNRAHRGALTLLLGTLAVLGMHVGVHQVFFAPLYHPMGNSVLPGLGAAGVVALLIGAWALSRPRRTREHLPGLPESMRGLRLAAVVGFAVWVFCAWYVRPHLTVDGRVLALFTRLVPHLNEAGWFAFLAGRNARNFWYLQALFGAAGLLAALAGVSLLIVRTRTIWRTAWLAASLGVLIALMTQISHEPFMMFVTRRLVPVILPLLCLGVAALCHRCEDAARAHPRRGFLAGLLILALPLAGTFGGTVFLATQREWPGLADWFDQLADAIPPGAVVYSDAPGFAAPLRFLYGIPAWEARPLAPGQGTDAMAMMTKGAEHQAVFWLTQTAVPEAYAAQTQPTASLPLRSVILGASKHSVPRHVRARGGTFTLYRISPPVSPPDE